MAFYNRLFQAIEDDNIIRNELNRAILLSHSEDVKQEEIVIENEKKKLDLMVHIKPEKFEKGNILMKEGSCCFQNIVFVFGDAYLEKRIPLKPSERIANGPIKQYQHHQPKITKKPNVLRTIYMPNYEVDKAREEIEAIRGEIAQEQEFY